MSTRCNVVIKDKWSKFTLYHHHDGYPSGVGKDLKSCIDRFLHNGWPLYAEDLTNWLIKNDTGNTGIKDTEYEITNGLHFDIEYLYEIDCENKELSCFSVIMDWDTGKMLSKKWINMNDL